MKPKKPKVLEYLFQEGSRLRAPELWLVVEYDGEEYHGWISLDIPGNPDEETR